MHQHAFNYRNTHCLLQKPATVQLHWRSHGDHHLHPDQHLLHRGPHAIRASGVERRRRRTYDIM